MTGRWQRITSGVILAVLAIAAVAVAILAKVPRLPVWTPPVLAGAAFIVGILTNPFNNLLTTWVGSYTGRHNVISSELRMRDTKGHVRRVRGCTDAVKLGVHPAAASSNLELYSPADSLPKYVPRDMDPEVQKAIDAGGLLIIEGPSAVGKTRMAFEVIRKGAPKRWLIVPERPESLVALRKAGVRIRNAIVWVDNIDRYLITGGLSLGVLDSLCPDGNKDVLVIGTLTYDARRELTSADLDSSIKHEVKEVMDRARVISLSSYLTTDERERAEALNDPRVNAALTQEDAGFAEYLAAGPATLSRWFSARNGEQLTAAAIITAAVDSRRAGFLSPIPIAMLEQLHWLYLSRQDSDSSSQTDFSDGLDWATAKVLGASGCLNNVGKKSIMPFDYLMDNAKGLPSLAELPDKLWDIVLSHAKTDDLVLIAKAAREANRLAVAEVALRRAAESGKLYALRGIESMLSTEMEHESEVEAR